MVVYPGYAPLRPAVGSGHTMDLPKGNSHHRPECKGRLELGVTKAHRRVLPLPLWMMSAIKCRSG